MQACALAYEATRQRTFFIDYLEKKDLPGGIKQIGHIETSFPIRDIRRHHNNLALTLSPSDPTPQEKSNIDSPPALPISDKFTSKALFTDFAKRRAT